MRIIRLLPHTHCVQDWSPRVWVAIRQALNIYPSGDARAAVLLERVIDRWDGVSEPHGDDEARGLKPAGGQVHLEDSEFEVLKKAWESYAPKLLGGNVRLRVYLDVFLGLTTPEEEGHPALGFVRRLTADEYRKIGDAANAAADELVTR